MSILRSLAILLVICWVIAELVPLLGGLLGHFVYVFLVAAVALVVIDIVTGRRAL